MRLLPRKALVFWPLLALLVLADCSSKRLAVEHLTPAHAPHPVVGDFLQFTLAYNPGAATGIELGGLSRPVFSLLALGMLVILGTMYRQAHSRDRWMAGALALVAGGAIGNLLDRLRSARGVVDFIDVGVGSHRFWIFNLADVGVTVGAALLAVLLWRRGDHQASTPTSGRHRSS